MMNPYSFRSRVLAALLPAILSFASFNPSFAGDGCPAEAGTLTSDFGPICLVNGQATLTGVPNGDAVVPDGYTTLYVLTRTNGLIIEQVSADPVFTVTSEDVWRLHSLVYDPTTLDLSVVQLGSTYAYQVQDLLAQGGGSICAALDISGAPVKTGICPCDADAGGITTDFGPICLVNGEATLTGVPTGNAEVPAGYSTLYVLTRTNGLIIEQVSADPVFTVTTEDVWRIHTLVYDPATLDLSIVEFGSTNAYQVQDLLIQGGGTICASLDISGAPAKTGICEQVCTADAGTISADQADLCLTNGSASLMATPDGNANVPVGYQVIFVLTEGPDLVIANAGPVPMFTVTDPGSYIVHTLVYDPATLDLSSIVFGETTGAAVNSLLQQGGGSICASLDLVGAQFQVADCTPLCTADAGTLTAAEPELCLVNGLATMTAVPSGDAVVPDGFVVAYVLTRGPELFIQNVEPDPEFEWPLTGEYTVHTLVYDPATLDLGWIQFDVSTGFDVNALLLQGGGSICGSLDVLGASFTITQCEEPCTANAGSNASVTVCSNAPAFDLFSLVNGDPGGSWIAPDGTPNLSIFSPGLDAPGTYMYVVSATEPCPNDTAFVTVEVSLAPDAGISAQIVVCDTAPAFSCLVLLGGNVDQGGTWTGPNGAPFSGVFNPAVDAPGIYVYTVAGSGPCADATSTVMIMVETCAQPCDADAGTGGDVLLCFNGPVVELFSLLTGTPDAGGVWFTPDGQVAAGVFDPSLDPQGGYTYFVTDGPDCPGDTTNLVVSLIECGGELAVIVDKEATDADGTISVALNETSVPGTLYAWPNPTTDVLYLSIGNAIRSSARVEVLDALGQPVSVLPTFGTDFIRLDATGLSTGAYTVRVTDGTELLVGRFVRAAN